MAKQNLTINESSETTRMLIDDVLDINNYISKVIKKYKSDDKIDFNYLLITAPVYRNNENKEVSINVSIDVKEEMILSEIMGELAKLASEDETFIKIFLKAAAKAGEKLVKELENEK